MAGQELPASLQTQMDIWIIMGSQLEPLVKVACLIIILSTIVLFAFTERKYPKDYTSSALDIYLAMDQADLAGSNWLSTNLVLMWDISASNSQNTR